MAKNNDGLEAGADVTWEEMVAANLARKAPDLDIDAMTKKELAEVLEAHGAEFDGRSPVAELRALAKRVLLVDL